jgi:MFS transporter, DHA3 family, macrolide efflux protein
MAVRQSRSPSVAPVPRWSMTGPGASSVRLLLLAAAISGIGSWAALIAMWGVTSYRFHGTATSLAVLAIAWTTPGIVFGPFAGIAIDRVGPRLVAIGAYLAGGGASLGMGLTKTYPPLIGWAVLLGASRAFAGPAIDAMPPRMVELAFLLRVNTALAAASNISIVLGPLTAGAIMAHWSISAVFFVDAFSYMIGAALLTTLKLISQPERRSPANGVIAPNAMPSLSEALRVIIGRSEVRIIYVLMGSLYFSWAVYLVLEPLYVRTILKQPVTTFAYLQMTFGVGFLFAAALLARSHYPRPKASIIAICVALSGAAAAGYIGTRITAIAFISIFLWGATDILSTTPARTLLQTWLPINMHGRIFALDRSLNSAANLIALPLAGFASDTFGVQVVGLATSLLVFSVGALALKPLLASDKRETARDIDTRV